MKLNEKYQELSPHARRVTIAIVSVLALAIALVLFAKPLVSWFSLEPMGDEASEATEVRAGDFSVDAALRPDPPRQKGNTMLLTILDPEQKPVEDAEVEVTYLMPAMGAMAEMRGEADVREKGDGRYEAAFDLPMGGSWTLTVDIRSEAGAGQARYNLTVGTAGLVALDGAGGASNGPTFTFPAETLEELRRAFASYEKARALLAADRIGGVALHADSIARALERAGQTTPGSASEVSQCLADGAIAANRLAAASTIDEARAQFAELSRFLMSLGASDRRLQEGWHVFACPMISGFNKWMQTAESTSNPYMGTAMESCGSESEWGDALTGAVADRHAHGGDAAYYTCSMHPSVKQDQPGTCPICSMDLTPVTHEELESGIIRVDPVRTQKIGVRIVEVSRRPLTDTVRAVGRTTYDESNVRDVTLKLSGWIEKMYVNETGQAVRRGQALLALYSPELYAAQQEYLLALQSQRTARETGAPDRADYLVRASRQRLKLWDFSDRQIDQLASKGQPLERVPIYSPYSGYVVSKEVNEGAAVQAGQRILRIASLDNIWVEADVYESDLGKVRTGQPVTVKLPYVPGKTYQGEISYIYPWLDPATRTGRIRIELPNRNLELRPEMYADVEVQIGGGESTLAIPASAVLDTGRRQIVFVDLGEGRFKPKSIQVGDKRGNWYQVLSGLNEGDRIVSSANFLISSESRIRSAEQFWGSDDEAE
ncbi:MAG: efflux RND transporter periplasmic adaptor subunit [Acidobacteria bacterium]|nr:efflux RND transporter periplasmic adaptor subunit [Acidobacteriota bacterium]